MKNGPSHYNAFEGKLESRCELNSGPWRRSGIMPCI